MSALLINTGISRSNLERFWPLWILFAAAWLMGLVLPIATIVPAVGDQTDMLMPAGWMAEYFASLFGCAVASIVTVNFVFDYLFSQPSAVFHGSLPIKRSSLFLSTYVSGLLPLIAIEVAIGLVLLVFTGVFPPVEPIAVWTWLGLTLGFTFVFYSLAALCAVLTGTRSMATSLYVLLNFFVLFVEGFLRIISSVTLWGVSTMETFRTMWTSPLVGLAYYGISNGGTNSDPTTVNFIPLIAYCALAIVFVICAVLLHGKRDFERAGSTTAFRGVRVLCKYVLGVFGALFFGLLVLFFVGLSSESDYSGSMLASGGVALITIFMIIGGFLGLFFAEVVLSKSKRVLKKCWKGSIALAVLSIAFMVGCSMDVLHIASYVPKASDVKSVELSNNAKLEQEDNIQLAIDAHQKTVDYGWHWSERGDTRYLDFTYVMKDGIKLSRSYTIYVSEDYDDASSVIPEAQEIFDCYLAAVDSEEGLESRISDFLGKPAGKVNAALYREVAEEDESESVFINAADVNDLIEGPVMKDMCEHGLYNVGYDVYGEDGSHSGISCRIELDTELDNGEVNSLYFYLTKSNCPNTAKWLQEHYGVTLF